MPKKTRKYKKHTTKRRAKRKIGAKKRFIKKAVKKRSLKRKTKSKKRWIQKAVKKMKRGALHRQLKIPMNKKIPLTKLRWAAKQPGKLGKRARFALNIRKVNKKRFGK